jgi:hypothetical protein
MSREFTRLILENYTLSNPEIKILDGLIEGNTYAQIAFYNGYSENTIKKYASNLWKRLSDATGEKINSKNYSQILNRILMGKILPRELFFLEDDILKVELSIEFPSEYWQAGTSVLSYFSHVLNVKYPNKKIKVKIEQEGLTLRMVIDTPSGEREEIEKTLDEYGLVVIGKMQPEEFIGDPIEAMALKNKLEIANLELR